MTPQPLKRLIIQIHAGLIVGKNVQRATCGVHDKRGEFSLSAFAF
jgi:hypothetical protein